MTTFRQKSIDAQARQNPDESFVVECRPSRAELKQACKEVVYVCVECGKSLTVDEVTFNFGNTPLCRGGCGRETGNCIK